jgi:hypothetical protein
VAAALKMPFLLVGAAVVAAALFAAEEVVALLVECRSWEDAEEEEDEVSLLERSLERSVELELELLDELFWQGGG